jgi:hypothetical protein
LNVSAIAVIPKWRDKMIMAINRRGA